MTNLCPSVFFHVNSEESRFVPMCCTSGKECPVSFLIGKGDCVENRTNVEPKRGSVPLELIDNLEDLAKNDLKVYTYIILPVIRSN